MLKTERIQQNDPLTSAISIVPDTSLIAKTGKTGYTTPQAIAEFVDNAIDARVGRAYVNVEVRIRRLKEGARIEIEDNGCGMDAADLAAALTMARSAKRGTRIGRFGMGMKTAASTLGRSFSVTTKKSTMGLAIRTVYNEEAFISGGEWMLPVGTAKWTGPGNHGTLIEIWDLKISAYGGLEQTICDSLAKTFRHFLQNGFCRIQVNRELVKPAEIEVLPGWRREFELEFAGKRIRGWIGLQPEHRSREYGVDLIRHNRVMRECDKLMWNAHPSLGFIRGELFLDEFETNFSKTDFDRNSEEWKSLMDRLKEVEFADIAAQSRKMASSKAVSDQVKAEAYGKTKLIEQVINSPEFADVIAEFTTVSDIQNGRLILDYSRGVRVDTGQLQEIKDTRRLKESGGGTVPSESQPKQPSASAVHRSKKARLAVEGLQVEHEFLGFGRQNTDYKSWEILGTARRVLRVVTNESHPIFETHPSKSFWAMHNVAESVAEYLRREAEIVDIVRLKGRILAETGKRILAEIERPATS